MLHLPGTPQQPRFTEGATEAQRGGVTCPESHGVGGRAYQKVEQGEGLTGSDEGWGSPEGSRGGVGWPGRRKQPNSQQGSCTERQPPRPVWEAGRGRHEGEPGTTPLLSLLGGRGEGRALGARRRANQEELLPRRPQRSWWWGGGKSQGVGVIWPRGPEPRQDLLRQRLLCPWLLSQGQTFPGLQGHHSAGEGSQVGAIPMPWSPTARGHASGSQTKGWELCHWRGRGTGWARPMPMSASSLVRAFRAIQGFMGQASSIIHQLCGLGPGDFLCIV